MCYWRKIVDHSVDSVALKLVYTQHYVFFSISIDFFSFISYLDG